MAEKPITLPDLNEAETQLLGDFAAIPEAQLLDLATMTLGHVIARCPMLSEIAPDAGAKRSQCRAIFVISVRMLRAIRAAKWLWAVGYVLEVAAMMRLAFELAGRLQQIVNDPSGATADRWMFTKKGLEGAGAAVQLVFSDLDDPSAPYKHLSKAVHADPRGAAEWLTEGDEHTSLVRWEPHRDTPKAQAALIALAELAYGTTNTLAQTYGLGIPDPLARELADSIATSGRKMDQLVRDHASQ